MRRFFFLQNSPVDCFVKPKELTELGTGRSQFVRAGVQRVQPFVHGYRECNIPVQVKGGSLAQLSGVSPLSTGYYLTQKAARNQLRCPSPLSGKSKRKGGTHVKLTRHNGRAGKNGVYNPKHNDRSFDIANSEHIDEERAKQNLYWDCYNGLGQFTRNYTQTVKRAADNKRRYAPGWVHSTCLLRGFPKGAAPHLAHDFAEQSVVCYTLCRRCPENTVAAGEGKGI